MRWPRSLPLLLWGGVVGPAAFVGAWVIGGATAPRSYSAVDSAISDLAAVGASTRVLMTVGFVVFGCGLIAFGLALRVVLEGRAWIAALVTGACTLGVAATPLKGWSGDTVHGAFAGVGYVAIVALPFLAAPSFARRGWTRGARLSLLTAAVSAVCLVAITFGPAHGLWQRLGLTVGDVWIVVTASCLLVARRSDRVSRT
jgi:Protein of unknown function (DUF998)